MRKGQGLPLNVIILALLGLAVLIVLIIMFTGKAGDVTKATGCEARGGSCISVTSTCGTGIAIDKPVRSFITCETPTGGPGICCLPELK